MLGTDYPFPLGELEPGKTIEESEFDDETKALMLGENCLRFLGLEKEKFIRSKSEVEDTQSS